MDPAKPNLIVSFLKCMRVKNIVNFAPTLKVVDNPAFVGSKQILK